MDEAVKLRGPEGKTLPAYTEKRVQKRKEMGDPVYYATVLKKMNLQIMPTGDGKNAGYEWHRFMKTG